MPAPHAPPRALSAFAALSALVLLAGCSSLGDRGPLRTTPNPANAQPPRAVDHGPWPNPATRQLVVVLTPNWDAPQGRLARFERDAGGAWRPVGASFPVMLGRSGSAWGLGVHAPQADGPQKAEGDGRAPAGVFAIGTAFGYADRTATRLAYAPMQREHWCIDVPGSPLYNRIVDTREVGAQAIEGSTEPMRRDLQKEGDPRYRLGFVIEHNAMGVDRAGSCIFAHLWKGPDVPTAGCTAMADADMATLLGWLDPAATPRFVLLPVQAYARLQAAWDLPAPGAGNPNAGPAGATPLGRDAHE
jgi:L,D-peptidoglycan transpeptidase YkuD (ErfK/YbiS/YcfS/YnhG family)